jgi:DNA-directed RNA polymerase specialized sigma24 family protein
MSAPKLHLEKSEAELIAMSCAGDRDAFYCLIHPCERGVFTAAMSILNNAADAEEVVHEAMIKETPSPRILPIGGRSLPRNCRGRSYGRP